MRKTSVYDPVWFTDRFLAGTISVNTNSIVQQPKSEIEHNS